MITGEWTVSIQNHNEQLLYPAQIVVIYNTACVLNNDGNLNDFDVIGFIFS